ncbi:hypothetical protein [Lacticaseibacillus rhamnosus]|uniref:hypothetical protein n=1 Tax=Lacticaseibacillus rhamnosus TaxID=47715 RepID=UPI00237F663E|nr:hypothetical protein [Lacticaseibacillus rhamnosus]MDE3302782.1 hypothetical protein [Lacticaseibacillus rhamnosus]
MNLYYATWLIFLATLFVFKDRKFVKRMISAILDDGSLVFGIRTVIWLALLGLFFVTNHTDWPLAVLILLIVSAVILIDWHKTFQEE